MNNLFKENEQTCVGDMYTTELGGTDGPFFSINPLKESRADINVTEYRNFLFEIDSLPLQEQLAIFHSSGLPFASITYSGGKSYHAILAVSDALPIETGTQEGIMEYKRLWLRLSRYIDQKAIEAGHVIPDGHNSFCDRACMNPSRFSRRPGHIRDGILQEQIVKRAPMQKGDFLRLCMELPVIGSSSPGQKYEGSIETEEEFFLLAPSGLTNTIKFVDWAAPEGLYPKLFKLTLWAIDSTGCTFECFCDIMEKYVHASLEQAGYPKYKWDRAVEDAFALKGLL